MKIIKMNPKYMPRRLDFDSILARCTVATQNVVTLQNVVIITLSLATALTSIGKM